MFTVSLLLTVQITGSVKSIPRMYSEIVITSAQQCSVLYSCILKVQAKHWEKWGTSLRARCRPDLLCSLPTVSTLSTVSIAQIMSLYILHLGYHWLFSLTNDYMPFSLYKHTQCFHRLEITSFNESSLPSQCLLANQHTSITMCWIVIG